METIRFWYTFEDETGQVSNSDITIELSSKKGINKDKICDAFVRFLEVVGYSTAGLENLRD